MIIEGANSQEDAYDLYEHVSDKEGLLREISRVTKPRGYLALTTGNRLFPYDRHKRLWFVDYLPMRLAKKYVWLMKHTGWDVREPTFWSLTKRLRRHFKKVLVDGGCVFKLVETVYPHRNGKLLKALKKLAKTGVFKFVSPKFVAITQK